MIVTPDVNDHAVVRAAGAPQPRSVEITKRGIADSHVSLIFNANVDFLDFNGRAPLA